MPRSRFHRLATAQQQAILDAALREFASHGYRDASLNRIIEASGVSKGSMYYYFDGKEDLYTHVIRVQLEGLIQRGGPLPVPQAQNADEFWATVKEYYLRVMRMLIASPDTAGLLRGWLSGSADPMLLEAQHEAVRVTLPWIMRTVAAGQNVGAVRTDVPAEFLVAMAMAMGQAMDTWLITRTPADADLPDAVHLLIDMMKRALEP